MKRKFNILHSGSYLLTILFGLLCVLPFVLVVVVSFTDEEMIRIGGYSLFPEKLSLEAYRIIITEGGLILNSYFISVSVTVVGTLLAVVLTGMAGYTLANKTVVYRDRLSLFFFITMVFSAGVVPWYLMCRFLGLKNNFFALLVPKLIFNPFNLFLVRNYMRGIPDSLREAAIIDGANDGQIAFGIYFPLALPVLAAITLFYGIGYWNDWWNAIMLVDNERLYPLQYLLFKLQSEIQMLRDLAAMGIYDGKAQPLESIKMATVVITVGPIILLYPFLQRYFIKGLIIGSVKG